MEQPPHIEYQGTRPRPRPLAIPLSLFFIIPGLIWALHEVAIMPEGPPGADNGTVLGGPEEAFVSVLIALLAIAWLSALLWCIAIRWRNKRAA